ncbi:MAG: UDP-N-acetylmuramoyl-L-alanyl-D-glutamate--2,6-diaminopimelate ligase [Deltaproteobacteria bacterium]|nr:UDP-N-acetylmuramoyl-L-alanyl-D-glutamate--2,6-diaminopimelate ligase [Deltaproteobacteria bacterium]
MLLSDLLKTADPVTFYGIEAEKSGHVSDIGNTEHPDPDAGFLLSPDPDIGSIHYRAQDVRPGGLFVAIEGLAADGHDFIDEALTRGASAIVTQKPVNSESIIVEVENTRKALAAISAQFFSNPSEKLFLIGITGTNGKTTTAFLIEHILHKTGAHVGVIGTLNYRYAGKTFENPMTTPESFDLQKILAEMLDNRVTHVVMEVSSHALDLHRVHHCKFDLAIFTNLTQDHLDYHQDMDSYWSCKKRLFTEILDVKSTNDRVLAVINHNDERGRELSHMLESRLGQASVLSVGFSDNNRIRPEDFSHDLEGIAGKISTPNGAFKFKSHLVGRHNLENILCATGVGIALGLSVDAVKHGIESVKAVPGRLESIPNDHKRFVYVDYAHTPDALENVLASLRECTPGRLICVLGCGGDRDKAKRSQMGDIAGRLSDLVVITSDNPRTEPPMEIIDQILEGTKRSVAHAFVPSDLIEKFSMKGYVVEPDRKNAITLAIKVSRPNDAILIAGKGNEPYQIIGDKTIAFDDRKEAKKALSTLNVKRLESKTRSNLKVLSDHPNLANSDLIPWRVSEVIDATGGKLFCGDSARTFTGVSIDSRRISAGDLFVAIKGEVHDGHRFIGSVIEQGINACLVDQRKTDMLSKPEWSDTGVVCITVDDTSKALGDMAAFNRRRTPVSVIAITGSNGKTSTRKMTSEVVSRRFTTLSTQGNLNNDIGLPLTLLNLTRDHQWAVVELGMNRPGEIERLGEICLPDVGLITNIGPAHLEGLGSVEAVMKAKGELLGKIKPDGTAILNADDPRVMKLADITPVNILFFGMSKDAAIRAESVKEKGEGLSFSLVLPDETISVHLKTPAMFMISNALAAAAAGHLLGLTAVEIKNGLEAFKTVQGRMNIHKTGKGIHIIDDTYNANPGSMQAAIITLTSLKGKNRGYLITGDMLELGKHSASMHQKIGSIAARSEIAGLYVTGKYAEDVAKGALEEHVNPDNIFKGTREEIIEAVTGRLDAGDWVLVKGSRGMAMEKVVQGLLSWGDN